MEDNAHGEDQRLNLENEIENKLRAKFNPTTPMIPGLKLFPKTGCEVLSHLCALNSIPQLCFIGGPSSSGKSTNIKKALENRKDVLYIPLRGNNVKESLQISF